MIAERHTVALTRLLRPRSVAIVGISPESGSIGANVLDNLVRIGFAGDIHLVSRTNREIAGRHCYSGIDELPEGVDAAVLAVPRQAAVEAIRACVRRKLGAALVFASGFAEMDETGRALQESMAQIAREGSLALCGPNCIGFVNLTDRVALTFEPLTTPPAPRTGEDESKTRTRPAGDRSKRDGRAIGVITQSGAMCSTLRLALLAKKLDLSCVVSTGNEAQLTTEDFLAFLVDDEATKAIVLFMEQVRNPKLFLRLAAQARQRGKPIVLMHPGRSSRAQASARTHTGAMADNHAVMATLVAREAVIVVDTLDELIDTADILARFPKPPQSGAAVMTNSGAFKGYALDFVETIGLDLPTLSAPSAEAIKAVLPPFAAIENPIDTTAQTVRDPGILGRTAAHLLADPAMGSLVISIVAGAPRYAMDKANAIMAGIAIENEKPVAVATMGDETELPAEFAAMLRDRGLAFFRSPDRALRAMAQVTWYGRALRSALHRGRPEALPPYAPPPFGACAEYQGKALLSALSIAVPQGALARSPAEAREIAQCVGYPVALKAQAAALSHKSDAGGVVLNIADAPALVHAWDKITARLNNAACEIALDGMLVEAMAADGLELVIGARRDPLWGPIITIGLGGIWIEALRDIRLLPADLNPEGIIDELRKLKGAALLAGHRGRAAADLDAVAAAVRRLAALICDDRRIVEIEINPLRVYAKGAVALDVLLQVEDSAADPE